MKDCQLFQVKMTMACQKGICILGPFWREEELRDLGQVMKLALRFSAKQKLLKEVSELFLL